jgi:hypothetical protein
MSPMLKIASARLAAREVAECLHVYYWRVEMRDATTDYLLKEAHKEFAKLADALGYRIEKIEAPAKQTEAA